MLLINSFSRSFRFLCGLCLAVASLSSVLLLAQTAIPAPPTQVPTSAQNPIYGSVPEKPEPGVLSITFGNAIDRALRQNLAGLLSEYNTIQARGEKWQRLSDLLPNVTGNAQESALKQSLIAEGFGKIPPGTFGSRPLPAIIGPFSYFDVRASASEHLSWKINPAIPRVDSHREREPAST